MNSSDALFLVWSNLMMEPEPNGLIGFGFWAIPISITGATRSTESLVYCFCPVFLEDTDWIFSVKYMVK